MARLDDMATRIIAGWYFLHQDEAYTVTNFNAFNRNDEVNNKHLNVQADHCKPVREISATGTVLLKNTNGALSLNKLSNIVLIGSDAGPGTFGPNEFSDQGGSDGILAMGWGSGTGCLPLPDFISRGYARQDGSSVFWDFDDWNTALAGNMAIITVDGNEGDRYVLRTSLSDSHVHFQPVITLLLGTTATTTSLLSAQNNNTIVVVNSVGPFIIEPWIEHPNITAVVWAGIPGQETGNAIADVLYGAYNLSGRLPYTIAKDLSDYPAQLVTDDSGSEIVTIGYTEGLHEPAFQVTFKVTNTGTVSGTEIPQLYIHHPSSASEPPSVFKGFTNVEISLYDTKQVSITLSRYDLSIWTSSLRGGENLTARSRSLLARVVGTSDCRETFLLVRASCLRCF
ncbi:glycoside hydrolase family 3 protein [Suillus brevipes Sb2]|nr:glycoside hydrolase family 3 protein [Suillus brevipes Sb2]